MRKLRILVLGRQIAHGLSVARAAAFLIILRDELWKIARSMVAWIVGGDGHACGMVDGVRYAAVICYARHFVQYTIAYIDKIVKRTLNFIHSAVFIYNTHRRIADRSNVGLLLPEIQRRKAWRLAMNRKGCVYVNIWMYGMLFYVYWLYHFILIWHFVVLE